ncbi:type IV secretion system DNA-binding domain-containing protein [Holosporaceae bacterium 'Namur']|nr:type IV secretion system DNA-binding domain-containing protein [Holosporaceae bacterium 'Namur']
MREVEEVREGLSYGAHEMRDGVNVNKQKITQHLVLPTELIRLNSKEGYFCMAEGYPVAKVEFKHTNWSVNNEKLIEVEEPKILNEKNNTDNENEVACNKIGNS